MVKSIVKPQDTGNLTPAEVLKIEKKVDLIEVLTGVVVQSKHGFVLIRLRIEWKPPRSERKKLVMPPTRRIQKI